MQPPTPHTYLGLIIEVTLGTLILSCIISYQIKMLNRLNKKTFNISIKEIESTQEKWAEKIKNITKAHHNKQDYQSLVTALIQHYAYEYEQGTVLFKPTKAVQTPFRTTAQSARSYFINGDKNHPEDQGFALDITDIQFNNHRFYLHSDIGIVMGEYIITYLDGHANKIEYTFGFVKDEKNTLKIVLHHSSLPYSSTTTSQHN